MRLIVPLSAGSTGDTVARALAPALGRTIKRPIMVENLPGAGGSTGTAQMVRAAKDGNTLALVTSTHVINPGIYKSMPFDAIKDITPIAVIGASPGILLVNPALPIRNLEELVAYARAHPGVLNYGSSGNGTTLHLLAVMLGKEAGIEITHVPYRGNAPMVTDLIAGQVQLAFQSTTAALPYVNSGQLRPVAVTTRERSRLFPQVPTLIEQGLRQYDISSWMAIIGPAGMTPEKVRELNQEINQTLAMPEVRDWFQSQDFIMSPGTPETAIAFFRTELVKHARLVRESGARLE